MPILRITYHVSRVTYCAFCFALALVIIGYFGPWVPHKAAGLTVTGAELADFARLFGSPRITRELFFTPILAAAILIGLIVNQPTNQLTNQPTNQLTNQLPFRILLTLIAASLALVALPPYPFLRDLMYRSQLILAVVGVGLTFLTLLARRLPRWIWGILVSLLASSGAIPALWQFARFHPLVVTLYGRPVGVGWGSLVCAVGFALLLAWGIWGALGKSVYSSPIAPPTR